MGRQHEIKIHTKGALANGVTRDEIREMMVHAFLYCGIPLMVDAMRASGGSARPVGAGEKAPSHQ